MPVIEPVPARTMSIETLLQWAYGVELVNAAQFNDGEPEPHEQHPMWKLRVDGTPGSWAPDAVSRKVDPDAKVVSAAVTRLRDGAWAEGVEWPPIAYAVEGMSTADLPFIEAAIPRAEMLVVCNARLGCRPDCTDIPTSTPARAPNGRPMVLRMQAVAETTITGDEIAAPREMIAREERARVKLRAGLYPFGSYCLLQWFPDPSSVLRDRADYVVWRQALRWLRAELNGNLSRIALNAAVPIERPWIED